jgi:hypothetical protein
VEGGSVIDLLAIPKQATAARTFTFIRKAGYASVCFVTDEPMRFAESILDIDGEQRHTAGLPIDDNYVIPGGEERGGLRIRLTLGHPTAEFGLDGESTAESDQSVSGPRAEWLS